MEEKIATHLEPPFDNGRACKAERNGGASAVGAWESRRSHPGKRRHPKFDDQLAKAAYPELMGRADWEVEDSPQGIVITVRGHDKSDWAVPATRRFRLLAGRRQEPFAVLVDLTELTGYESATRQHWQETMREYRSMVQCLVLIGAKSPIIRMGAAVVGAFAGIPVHFVDNWSTASKLDLSA